MTENYQLTSFRSKLLKIKGMEMMNNLNPGLKCVTPRTRKTLM